jgi:hypothetical protein
MYRLSFFFLDVTVFLVVKAIVQAIYIAYCILHYHRAHGSVDIFVVHQWTSIERYSSCSVSVSHLANASFGGMCLALVFFCLFVSRFGSRENSGLGRFWLLFCV